MGRLEDFGMAYLESRLPGWFYPTAQALQIVALYKDNFQVNGQVLAPLNAQGLQPRGDQEDVLATM